jgi:hypothetical protein
MLALSCPVIAWSASGRCVARVGTVRTCAFGRLGGASGRSHLTVGAVTVEIGRSVLNVEGHVDSAWRPNAVQRVRSSRFLPSEGVTTLFDHGVINRCLGRPWPVAEHP